MTLKVIARTNAPRTCLWCGQKLRQNTRYLERAVTKEEYDVLHESQYETPRKRMRHQGDKVTSTYKGGMNGEVQYRVSVAIPDGTYGFDEHFCTGRCAQLFGWAAARNGYRFEPTAK